MCTYLVIIPSHRVIIFTAREKAANVCKIALVVRTDTVQVCRCSLSMSFKKKKKHCSCWTWPHSHSCSSTWMSCGGVRCIWGKQWTHLAIIRLKTTPSVAMATGSNLHRRSIPCGKLNQLIFFPFLFPAFLYPAERTPTSLVMLLTRSLQMFAEGARDRPQMDRDKRAKRTKCFYGFEFVITQTARKKVVGGVGGCSHPLLPLFILPKLFSRPSL